jgi:GcrA cell cycle regulator
MGSISGWDTEFETMGGKTPFALLRELAPMKSAGEIRLVFAQKGFTKTRNAICSKAAQNGIHFRGGAPGRGNGTLPRRPFNGNAAKPRAPIVAFVPEPPIAEEGPLTLGDGSKPTILTVNDRMCRWPIGDPAAHDFHFCGHNPKKDSPYCEAHTRKAYQPQAEHRALSTGSRVYR